MLISNQCSTTNVQRIGNAMRFIRNAHGESADAVSEKLGYANTSSYCKLERGEKKTLCVEKLIVFCEHFNFNIIFLFMLADIEIFKNKINTWAEFYKSLSNLPDEKATELMEIVNKLPPPPTKSSSLSMQPADLQPYYKEKAKEYFNKIGAGN